MLQGKKILLAVTGSIAAYKAAHLTRLLVKEDAEVRIIMTPAAVDFITPLTLSTLSKNPVLIHFQKNETGEWNNHVELGLWADLLLIAPASANTISKMAHGQCDNLVLATYLSARCPVFFAPAMDVDMLMHPSTQQNIAILRQWGLHPIEPDFGELASGLFGKGRLAEPEEIVEHLERFFSSQQKLAGKKAIVTAGPTYEAIDPVRFIGNHSTGKMGFAIAKALAEEGAEVDLITGPTNEQIHSNGIRVHRVTSADDMYLQCQKLFPQSDIAILSAAVADFKPLVKADQKIKKDNSSLTLELARTTDIAAALGKVKRPGQIMVGFALETENEKANASKKLREKNFDLIVLNSLNNPGAGFGHDTNQVEIISQAGSKEYPLKSKSDVAKDIVRAILEHQV
ncbi:MAG TPA: bifunctional phosphopantothenoylcysteine decarboxylase/phosphopantothenate--cysteine ligase CoaBC [Cyclobacteriaceae bacterium]|nr:bifunctional phosphopantothenoylcysteine decarboxylase/phosphopantothenate--cysteine ligase CoaBC [Cyclobacteriaceae bacterium]